MELKRTIRLKSEEIKDMIERKFNISISSPMYDQGNIPVTELNMQIE